MIERNYDPFKVIKMAIAGDRATSQLADGSTEAHDLADEMLDVLAGAQHLEHEDAYLQMVAALEQWSGADELLRVAVE